jgi:GTP cyclohydrolase I
MEHTAQRQNDDAAYERAPSRVNAEQVREQETLEREGFTVTAKLRRLERIGRMLLDELDDRPEREALVDTPARFARMWYEFIHYNPGTVDTTFASVQSDQMVVVSGMRVWSMCEHHLLPFWCDVSIGYITRNHVLGLSKFARIAHRAAHRLQIQERLGREIAQDVELTAQTPDVAVLCRGEHLCMTMRGIKTPALMTTSVMRGSFLDQPQVRAEFLSLAGSRR